MAASEILGLIGPNGAGKSTLLKILLGAITETEGSVTCMGKDPKSFSTQDKSTLGLFLGGESNLYYHLPVLESVRFFARLYDVPKEQFQQRCALYANLLDCTEYLQQKVATLSLGQRLRAELLCLLIYEPKLLILDEPTIGMDIEGKRRFRQVLHRLNREKETAILLTSHDLVDLEKVADRLVLIKNGSLLFDRPTSELLAECQSYRIVKTDCPLQDVDFLIEKDDQKYTYLVSAEYLDARRIQIKQDSQFFYEEANAGLEEILYEYYR